MWVALISQTGKELTDICKSLDIYPDLVLSTNERHKLNQDFQDLLATNKINFVYIPLRDSKDISKLSAYLDRSTLVTLHGWLRIIPEQICEKYNIYNGHPGDILQYPELKGFNPQEKAFNFKIPISGSVIHKVTSKVDEGPISYRVITSIQNCSLDQVYERLRYTSLLSWKLFFTKNLAKVNNSGKRLTDANKFAITGAHCTGKTTLVNAIQQLDKNNKFEYITSMTREAKQLGYKINESGNDETQLYILNKHLERLVINKPCVLDRSLIDGYTYTRILYEAGNISEPVMKYAKSLLDVEYMSRYEKIFYLPPTLQLVNDGLRSTEPLFRKHVINTFENIVQAANIFMPNLITTIDGTVQERVSVVNKFLNI